MEVPSILARRTSARHVAVVAALVLLVLANAGARGSDALAPATTPGPRAGAGAAYPLSVGATGRYLVDRRNAPFLIVGDSPQAMIANLSEQQADDFLTNRAAAGFNSVWVNLLCTTYTGGRHNGSTYDGIIPFTTPGDLSTPNEAYFSRVDDMLRLAAKHGIAVFLDPIETGGFMGVLRRNGLAKAYAYGEYLGRRYRRFGNLVWLNGNDFQTWRRPRDDALVLAVARGIRARDPVHVQTVELDYRVLVSASLDDPRWRPLIGLDAAYTYFPTYAEVRKEYDRPNFLPVFMIEANYEEEHGYRGPETLRRQEYWSLLSGAAGQFYGNKYTWQFLDGWPDHLNTTGSMQMEHVTRLFAHAPWFALVPDEDHTVVTAGYGVFAPGGDVNTSDYVTAARTPNGKLVMAYLPTTRTVTVNMAKLSGPVRARWYDPAAGTYAAISATPLKNTGSRKFTPPGRNRDGDGDWVLVLSTVGTPPPT